MINWDFVRVALNPLNIRSVREEICHSLDRGSLHCSNDNITNLERKALSSLRTRSDIIIKPADKGAATVVMMSKDNDFKKVMDHLSNMLLYEKLGDDTTEQLLEEITSVLARMTERETLDRDTFEFLQPKNAWISWFYILPKIHKKDIPGRPIVSGPPQKIYLYLLITI